MKFIKDLFKIRGSDGEFISIPAIKGEDGKTPEKGVDYWTDEDKAEIKSELNTDVNELKQDLSQKLTEPENMAVGKYFRIASIDENGHAVLEAVDAPTGLVSDVTVGGESVVNGGVANVPIAQAGAAGAKVGVVAFSTAFEIDSDNRVQLKPAEVSDISSSSVFRTSTKAITPSNLDYAVTAVLTDGKGAAWTAEEQLAGRQRLGLEWELIEEITFTEDITALTRNTEPNGTPYKFRGMRIAISANGVTPTKTDLGWIRYNNAKGFNNWIYNAPKFYDLQGRSIYVGEVIRNGNGYWEEWDFRGSTDNTNMSSSIQRSVGNMIWHNTNDISEFYLYNSSILAGMKMFIFAIR